jgi:hypothetical protein
VPEVPEEAAGQPRPGQEEEGGDAERPPGHEEEGRRLSVHCFLKRSPDVSRCLGLNNKGLHLPTAD